MQSSNLIYPLLLVGLIDVIMVSDAKLERIGLVGVTQNHISHSFLAGFGDDDDARTTRIITPTSLSIGSLSVYGLGIGR